jgi:hypothetical protein
VHGSLILLSLLEFEYHVGAMNVTTLASRIQRAIEQTSGAYFQLVLVVGPGGSGKTAALRQLASQPGCSYRNVSLELSRLLLDVEARQRPTQVARLVRQVAEDGSPPIALLDNLELLFDPSLEILPVALLRGIARNRVVVATWTGSHLGGTLTYATPGYREYLSEPVDGAVVVES